MREISTLTPSLGPSPALASIHAARRRLASSLRELGDIVAMVKDTAAALAYDEGALARLREECARLRLE